MGVRGPERSYEDLEVFQKAIDEYFFLCERSGVFPDIAGMRVYMRLTSEELKEFGEKDGYKRALLEARDRRESWISRNMVDNKKASGCMNLAKQPDNGGFIDRPVDSGEVKFTIKLDGVGGEKAGK